MAQIKHFDEILELENKIKVDLELLSSAEKR